jgi:uncharacterized protein with FMN-binding domain
MRQGPVLAMSALTGAVLVASLSRSAHVPTAGAPAAPVGVVLSPTSAPPATATARRRATRPSPTSRRATRSPAAVRVTSSPRPRQTATTAPSVVVNGQSVDTRYGPVQVQITIRSHRIVKAEAIDYPRGSSTDRQINDYAIPQLDDETLQAQSAQIDTVSGATYTSDGYRSSLQSALDSARAAGAW